METLQQALYQGMLQMQKKGLPEIHQRLDLGAEILYTVLAARQQPLRIGLCRSHVRVFLVFQVVGL